MSDISEKTHEQGKKLPCRKERGETIERTKRPTYRDPVQISQRVREDEKPSKPKKSHHQRKEEEKRGDGYTRPVLQISREEMPRVYRKTTTTAMEWLWEKTTPKEHVWFIQSRKQGGGKQKRRNDLFLGCAGGKQAERLTWSWKSRGKRPQVGRRRHAENVVCV